MARCCSATGPVVAHEPDGDITGRHAHRLRPGGRWFTVVNYDRRGRGESGPTGAGSLEREIEDIAALVEHVGGAAALYGSSSGAAIALWAATRGIGVTSVALWEPPLPFDDDGGAFAGDLQALLDAGQHERAVEYFMKDMPREWLEGSKASPAWPVMVGIAPSLAGDAVALAESQGGGETWARTWQVVTVPTVVLTGTETMPVVPRVAEGLAQVLPNARWATIEASGHSWAPEVMAGALTSFLLPSPR